MRIMFVVSTLKFINDAFYKWDGYSFRMHFIDFMPDLSLTFILWTFVALIFANILWITLYVLLKISQTLIKSIRFEHIMMWFIIVISLHFAINYLILDFQMFIGLTLWGKRLIVVLLPITIVWIGRKLLEKIPRKIDTSITPLVWLFAILFVTAIPLSFYEKSSAEANRTIDDRSQVYTLKNGGDRPNIILIVMDALAAKDMSLYGYDVPTTPFISKWAKDAIVFKNVYSTTNWTTPAMMSMMTGQRPWTHRTWYEPNFKPIDNYYEDNMPQVLRDHGYEVNSFVQNEYAHPYTLGIDKAFLRKDNSGVFSKSKEFWFFKLKDRLNSRPIAKRWLFHYNFIAETILKYAPEEHVISTPPEEVYNRFLEDLSKENTLNNQRPPFFTWLHTFPPHEPYLPPAPYMGMLGEGEKFNTRKKQLESGILYSKYKPEQQTDVDILRKRYDELILYSDKQFELFMSRLQQTIDMSNTIIIFTADHGQSFSHGYQAHDGPYLYESLVRVPLVIKMPGTGKGKVIETPIEIIDIAPTVLELVGQPMPNWMEGRSLVPLINGKDDSRPVYSMQLIRNRSIGNDPITKGAIAVREGDYKLIHYLKDNNSLLFNLKEDPNELKNLFNQEPEISKRLLTLINTNLKKANEEIGEKE